MSFGLSISKHHLENDCVKLKGIALKILKSYMLYLLYIYISYMLYVFNQNASLCEEETCFEFLIRTLRTYIHVEYLF